MKRLLMILLALLCASAVHGQYDKAKVAVYVTGKYPAENKAVGNRLVLTIVKQGKYTAVERSAEILSQLQKEYAYQRGGNVDASQISRVGKQLGVDIVCVAEISDVSITVKLIDVETAEITKMDEAYSNIGNMSTGRLVETTDRLAAGLFDAPYERKQKGFHLVAEALYLNSYGWGGVAAMGYRFNNYVALGAGGGYAMYAGDNFKGSSVPVFADLRVNILRYAVSPYVAVSGGVCFDNYTNTDNYTDNDRTISKTTEHEEIFGYYHVAAGLYVRCSDVFALHAGAGYNNIMNAFTVSVGFALTLTKN